MTTAPTARLEEFRCTLFTAAECATLVERLLDLEAFWIPRHRRLPFHTLGATNYYDITGNPARPYDRLARQYNPFLLNNFAEVYTALRAALAERLGAPVRFREGAALPGFHIFGADPAFAPGPHLDVTHTQWFQRRDGDGVPGNPIHVDTAHRALGLSGPTLSCTLALRLPASGAGLKIWPLLEEDTAGLGEPERLDRLNRTPAREVAYTEGALFVHSGDWHHQARGLPSEPGEHRITLQGHGVRRDDGWHLFW